ncbi:MAG: hypothetical protein L6Q97_09285 [Thermoanaerobaculia bacterium]|nr:hypothetical protein [Thermoanaerobaculia bacterium]
MMRNDYSGIIGHFLFAFLLLVIPAPATASGLADAPGMDAGGNSSVRSVQDDHKLSFGEKLAFKILQKKWEKKVRKNRARNPGVFEGTKGEADESHYNPVSFIFGLLSIGFVILAWAGSELAALLLVLALVLSVVGLVMGISSLRKGYPKRGLAVAGTVVSGIGLGMTILTGFVIALLLLSFG